MPVNKDKDPWTPETLALLGTMSDGELAKRIGRTKEAVFEYRRRRGIKAYRANPWGETELGLLRSYTDKEIARMTSRKIEDIAAKRREIS
jgi:hypothetical protein